MSDSSGRAKWAFTGFSCLEAHAGIYASMSRQGRHIFATRGSDTLIRTLLIVTALLEAPAGFALAVVPSPLVSLLIGSPLDTPSGSVVGRVAGIAVMTLGLVCWLARNDQQNCVSAGPVAAMLIYNVAIATILVYARLGLGLSGIGLWPTLALHLALALWCIACLRVRGR